MASVKNEYRHGRIIGTYLRTKKGGRELHPAAILTSDTDIIQPQDFDPRRGEENVVVVIGISTKYSHYPDPYVKLPFHPSAHAHTKLTKDSAAIIGWYDAVNIPDDCRFLAGDVPPELMVQINSLVRADIARKLGRDFTSLSEILPLLFE
jgi:hypothetical protein